MKRRLLLLPFCIAVGCTDHSVEVDIRKAERVALERRPAAEGLPRHYRATWVGEDASPVEAAVALLGRATQLCREDEVVYLPGTRRDPTTTAARDLLLLFHCQPVPPINVVAVAEGEALPPGPPVAAGQERIEGTSFHPSRLPRRRYEEFFGDLVRDIHVDECSGRATTLHRIATYEQTSRIPPLTKTHVVIDYSCADPVAAEEPTTGA